MLNYLGSFDSSAGKVSTTEAPFSDEWSEVANVDSVITTSNFSKSMYLNEQYVKSTFGVLGCDADRGHCRVYHTSTAQHSAEEVYPVQSSVPREGKPISFVKWGTKSGPGSRTGAERDTF